MGQKNDKQQKPMEEKKNANQSIVKKFAFLKLKHKKTRHGRLPLELECEIFKFLKLEIQQKIIWGMGPGICGIFRRKVLTITTFYDMQMPQLGLSEMATLLLIMSKRLQNPHGNGLFRPKTKAKISSNGLKANNVHQNEWHYVFAQKGFAISGVDARLDNYPGTILYYFEVKLIQMPSYNWSFYVGLSDANIPDGTWIRTSLNSYCKVNVCGCGLVLNPNNKVSIFFTGNGLLLGKKIPIFNHPAASADCRLYPTVHMRNSLVKFNFGDDKAKPFKYDIGKCPGLKLKVQ